MLDPPWLVVARSCGGMWALLAAVLLAGSAALEPPGALRCRHERCRYIRRASYDSEEYGDDSFHEDYYEVEDKTIQIYQQQGLNKGLSLTIDCYGANVLNSCALPRAEQTTEVFQLNLYSCPLPANGSIADTLTTLNLRYCEHDTIDKSCRSLLLYDPPETPQLVANHFTRLEHLRFLSITSPKRRVHPARGFLKPLRNLKMLQLTNVTLDELDVAPPVLYLRYSGIEKLPAAVYSSIVLQELTIYSDSSLEAVKVWPGLRILKLETTATTLQLDTAPSLETLSLANWVEPEPPRLTECNKLRKMHLTAPAMRTLPDGWLANCSQLEELVVEHARYLTALPKLLFNATSLKRLAFKGGVLETLPDSLEGMPKLNSLELDGNRLRTIPRYLLQHTFEILKVNLSSNHLNNSVVDTIIPRPGFSITKLSAIKLISELDLGHNPSIGGNICNEYGMTGYSPLYPATGLRKLILRGTGVTRICRDWRENMPLLKLLDLSGTNVTELSYKDLQFRRTVNAEVWLLGAPVGAVRVTREDFKAAARASPSFTNIRTDIRLQCDCRMYWARRALDPSLHALDDIRQLRCAGGGLLRDVPLEDMVCARPEECAAAELPPACACAVWADDDPDHDPRLVRVRCENASLTRVPCPHPRNDSTERFYELLLAHNQIADLDANDLQENIKGLDLRNNSLKRMDEKTAIKLSNVSGILRLAGNPLECNCSAAPLLRALHFRASGHTDLDTITCHNGSVLLHKVPTEDCPQPPLSDNSLYVWIAGVLAVLLALSLTVVIFLSSRSRRFFALAVLHRLGCVWRAAEPEEDESRRYDAFVTFSHVDSGVVRELMARLEPPYRLCIHYRDWIPGHFIAEQVVESVHDSRRTVALVSRHFLASKWARAEFREAHTAAMLDAKPRLIVVLLEEPAALELDEELQRYVATQTYLRWGDPWFWDKMAVALPPPRPASPPPSRVSRQPVSSSRLSPKYPLTIKI